MEKFSINNDVIAIGVEVKSFPEGIGEAFDKLARMLPDGYERPYYGISYFDKEGKIIYHAAALEQQPGEAEHYKCERYIIEKGNYIAATVRDWRKKTDSIKDVFDQLMKDQRIDPKKPCIEWYKTDEEMVCMIKAGTS